MKKKFTLIWVQIKHLYTTHGRRILPNGNELEEANEMMANDPERFKKAFKNIEKACGWN